MITEKQIDALYDIYKAHPCIATDSRRVQPGALFFALRGASFDGNRFAGAALDAGAACAVVDDPGVIAEYATSHPEADLPPLPYPEVASSLPPGPEGGPSPRFFLVEDALEALQALASHHRKALGIPILAITGTNGKTTTKELVSAVMSRKFNVFSTRGNLNNHIGVPLTLLSMTKETQFGVVEMGASAQGEIELLAGIAAPDFGLITNIGRAHLEGFGGEEGVRTGKGELYDYLASAGGTAIVRSDDPTLTEMAARRDGLRIKYYSTDYADGMESRLAGVYNRANVASAVAVGRLFGISDGAIREAICDYEPDNNRSQLIYTGRNILLADCYNANPSSMAAAIDNFSGTAAPISVEEPAAIITPDSAPDFAAAVDKAHGRAKIDETPLKKTAILGDMSELGQWSSQEHENVVRQALSGGIDRVIFVGARFSEAAKRLWGDTPPSQVETLPDIDRLKEYLAEAPIRDSIILLKGSRSMKLEEAIGLL